jgi:formate-dependent nitrite reductase cytochrome c552 subunit
MAAFCVVCAVGILSAGFLAAQQSAYLGIQEKLPVMVAPQPVAFSHRQHSAAGIKCVDCHTKALREERAGIPQSDRCMLCHATIRKDSAAVQHVARFAAEKKSIPWVRVYRLPDFVFFSHGVHAKASVECTSCHGPVAQRDVLQKEVSTSMRGCVDCHRSRKATIDCSRCHELGQ